MGVGGYRRILVGVDGTDRSFAAAVRAIEMAMSTGADLYVLSVVPVPVPGVPIAPAGRTTIDRSLTDRRARAAEAGGPPPPTPRGHPLRVTTAVVDGDPATCIVRTAVDVGADVIVVGNRGLDPAGRYVLGSVPEAVLHATACDVLIVRTA